MLNYRIITNNPLVHAKHPEMAELLDTDAKGVLITARDMVHLGARILNHPLSGMLPGVCPYKSLIMTGVEECAHFQTDFKSLSLIESALGAIKEQPEGFKGYDNQTLEDFRVLDLDMLDSALGIRS